MKELKQLLGGLPGRMWLTLREHGIGTFLYRAVTFPLRLTPLGKRLGLGARWRDKAAIVRRWYRRSGRDVAIFVRAGDESAVARTIESVRATTEPGRVTVEVAHEPARDLRALAGERDLVLLDAGVVAHEQWLEFLQFGAYDEQDVGITGPRLLGANGTIRSGGLCRNRRVPQRLEHRFRSRDSNYAPAAVDVPLLAAASGATYFTREALSRLEALDGDLSGDLAEADACLRGWDAGFRTRYCGDAVLSGWEAGGEDADGSRFWHRWSDWFDNRHVRTEGGSLRVIYVTEDTGVGGGHRVVFEHANGLRERGHEVELYSLDGPPDWFPLEAPVRTFDDYDALTSALSEQDAIKVATWWMTAEPVWLGSVRRGIPVYFVQDIETSYYEHDVELQHEVLASYREEFLLGTTSTWNRERLEELGFEAEMLPPGIRLDAFRDLGGERRRDVVLAIGRSSPLKNFPLTLEAWRALPEPRPELWLFGIEPDLAKDEGIRYFEAPSDEQVNELYNTATVFLQTSKHEGFCLPLLEAMATGCPVVTTDAHGNRDFCRDGENCLMVDPEVAAVRDGLTRVLGDPELGARLGQAGVRTAGEYAWEPRIDQLERVLEGIAR